MTVAAAPRKAHPARQQAIQPFLDKLQGWCRSPAGSQDLDRPARIGIGSQQLVVDSWERRLLLQFFDGSRDAEDQVPALLAHGFALVIKSTLDVERLKKLEANPSVEVYALQAELMLDTAIGTALLHEADIAIAATVQGGGVDLAKSLTVFRHKLNRAVSEAKKRIAASELQQAETLAGSMTDRPFAGGGVPNGSPATSVDSSVQTLIEEATAVVEAAPRRRRRRRRRSPSTAEVAPEQPPVRLPGRTGLLALAAGMLAVIWFAVVQAPALLRSDMRAIDRSQIGGTAAMTVVARPPSLFVTVPAARWEAMDATQREALIDSIASGASVEGYTGAVLTTDAGMLVARWLQGRGAELVADREDPPAVPDVTE